MWVKVIVYYLKSLGWDLFDVAIDCDDGQIQLIEWFCQHGVHSSGLSSSTESFNVAFVQISFSTVILSYTYGIADSMDATLAFYDDHFQAHRVSEKETKCN